MASFVRRAGTGPSFTNGTVIWSVAEGQRGRRWREMRTEHGVVFSSLLLETDPGRMFAHLELATLRGLLTLHPEPDGTLHGNTVAASGVSHISGVPWPAGSVLAVDGSVISISALGWALQLLAPQSGQSVPVVNVDPATLAVTATTLKDPASLHPPIDADGLPALAGGTTWPLEESG